MTTPANEATQPLERVMTADAIAGERVHHLMWRAKMPQRELALGLGITQSALSKKLYGERSWTIDELIAVARFFRVELTELLPGNDYAPVLTGRGRVGNPDNVRLQGFEPRTF